MPRGKGLYVDDDGESGDKADELRASRRADSDDATPDVDELEPDSEAPD